MPLSEHLRRQVRKAVAAVINRADPVGLLETGAPDDEYEMEIEAILAGLADAWPDEDAVTDLVQAVFTEMFSPDMVPAERCRQIARDIIQALQDLARDR